MFEKSFHFNKKSLLDQVLCAVANATLFIGLLYRRRPQEKSKITRLDSRLM